MNLFSRTDRSFLGRWWWTVDRPMLGALIVLMIVGIVLVATASPPVAQHLGLGSYYFIKRHVAFLVPSFLLMLSVSMLAPRQIWRIASIMLLLSIAGMIAVLIFGSEIKGAQRWLYLGFFSVQPSEFAKPSFAICAAWFMARQKQKNAFPGQAIAVGLYALLLLLLLLQPDLGMSTVLTFIFIMQFFLAGFPLRFITGIIGLGSVGLGLAYVGFDHVQSRIDRFLNPDSGDNYQVERSIEAFQNGGFFGAGPGQGTVKLALPDAHADFIFAVAAEEMGLIFVFILMSVFAFILIRGCNRLMEEENLFPILAAGGLLAMFGLQTAVHIGSSLNVLPAKGMTLPFISYGGSSLLSMGFSMGAVLAFTRRKSRNAVSRTGFAIRRSARDLAENAREGA